MFKFILEHVDSKTGARAGRIITDFGEIETPVFMPVGTCGSVKTLLNEDLKNLNANIILGNAYHLYLRPNLNILEKSGGLHKFMNWNKNILTDSGGYQVFSLKSSRKISEDGVSFTSHIDGSKHFFSPESSIKAQKTIGANIIMAFDECIEHPCLKKDAKDAMGRTHRWLLRSINEHKKDPKNQALFGIIQGSTYEDLRQNSAEFVSGTDVDGIAIGGLSVGESDEEMYEMTKICTQIMPQNKPRYLMGVGTPQNIIESIFRGIDMFDCVMPTRNARNGQIFTSNGKLHYKAGRYRGSVNTKIDKECNCFVCNNYSLGYLCHLFNSREISALRMATFHNIYFYINMMKLARKSILNDSFEEWKNEFIKKIDCNND